MATKKQVKTITKNVKQQSIMLILAQLTTRCDQLTQWLEQHAQLLTADANAIMELREAICPKVAARLTTLERIEKSMAAAHNELYRKVDMIAQDERNNCLAISRIMERQNLGAQPKQDTTCRKDRIVAAAEAYLKAPTNERLAALYTAAQSQ